MAGVWQNKAERAANAHMHKTEMESQFPTEINYSVDNTTIIPENSPILSEIRPIGITPKYIVDNLTSTEAAFRYHSGSTTILNFASFKHPGGMFLEGSAAQEEALCHDSILYNVLSDKKIASYYTNNRKNTNNALYFNRALFSKDVLFLRKIKKRLYSMMSEGPNDYYTKSEYIKYKFNVLTCAAPNYTAAKKLGVSADENSEALKSRVQFILSIADYFKTQTLILGAWGCGVFGQSAEEVAELFYQELDSGKYHFEKVVFSIPDFRNYVPFETRLVYRL